MRIFEAVGAGRVAVAIAWAAAAAGCAAPAPAPREGSVVVAKVDRVAWNAQSETGLFRISFDAARMQQVRREAAVAQSPEAIEAATVEGWLLEREAERELEARGLCSGSAKLAGALDAGDGKSGASGIFKCRPPVF